MADEDQQQSGAQPAQPTRPAQERRGPSRRTTSRQERRQRSAAKRARKRRFYMAGGLVIALALIAGLALPSFGVNPTPAAPEARPAAGTQLAIQEGDLLEPGETADYDTSPPTSGPSWAEAATWGVHEEQAPDEAVVRNLRNGGIVFNHNLTNDDHLAELQTLVESLPGYPDCYVMQPHAGVDEGEIEVTAWGWLDTLTPGEIDDLREFADDHRANAPDADSPGETCGSGSA